MNELKTRWDAWNFWERTIFVSGCVATISMFMSWVDIGIATRNGITQGTFLFLGLWVYPIRMFLKNKPIDRTWGLVCSIASVVCTIGFINSKSLELFGRHINAAGTGAWLFLFASIALIVAVVKIGVTGTAIKTLKSLDFSSLKLVFAWFQKLSKSKKWAIGIGCAVILLIAHNEATSDIGIFSTPHSIAIKNCERYLDNLGGIHVIDATAVDNDMELTNVSYPITVLMVVRLPGGSPSGYRKRVVSFACGANGEVIDMIGGGGTLY